MLDLTTISKFYELKWFDGDVLHLPKPTEKFLRRISSLDEQGLTEIEQLEEVKKITWELIRQNDEGRKFTAKELEPCDITVCSMIMQDYMNEVEKRLGE